MNSLFAALVLLALHDVAAQLKECTDPTVTSDTSPCLMGMCPEGYTCIQKPDGQEVCCENSKVVDVTTTITTTPAPSTTTTATSPASSSTTATTPLPTTTPPCRDLYNPLTGLSDCPRLSYLCNNTAYYNLMTVQCPLTCNRCWEVTTMPAPTTSTACRDLLNPSTGVSDCPRRSDFCTNAVYLSLMRQQCPKTCGYC